MKTTSFIALLLLLGGLCFSGCSEYKLKSPKDLLPKLPVRVEIPTSVTPIWKEHVATNSEVGKPTMRGFGGRVYFYKDSDPNPVKIDGMMIVNAFDEEGRNSNNTRPDRKFVFRPDEMKRRYEETKLGHSYNVWIPWDESGGPKKDISLIVNFTPVGGKKISSLQSTLRLPGFDPEPVEQPTVQGGGPLSDVHPAGYAADYQFAEPGRNWNDAAYDPVDPWADPAVSQAAYNHHPQQQQYGSDGYRTDGYGSADGYGSDSRSLDVQEGGMRTATIRLPRSPGERATVE